MNTWESETAKLAAKTMWFVGDVWTWSYKNINDV
jgi:hypothetical protein